MKHLSEEQFADLLAGELADDTTERHLLSCPQCRHELADLRSAVRGFGELSLDWARAEAPRRVRTPSRLSLHLGGRPGWGLGLGTLAAAAVIVCTVHAPVAPSAAPAALHAQQVAPVATADIAQDNRLLRSIDAELDAEETPAVLEAGTTGMLRHTRHPAKTTVND